MKDGERASTSPLCASPADSELGIELSKIRDRLNAMENWQQKRLGWENKWMGLIDALETDRKKPWNSFQQNRMIVERIDTLSDALHQVESKLANRVLALETKIEWPSPRVYTSDELADIWRKYHGGT